MKKKEYKAIVDAFNEMGLNVKRLENSVYVPEAEAKAVDKAHTRMTYLMGDTLENVGACTNAVDFVNDTYRGLSINGTYIPLPLYQGWVK